MKIEDINKISAKLCENLNIISDGKILYEFNHEYGYFTPIPKCMLSMWLKKRLSPADKAVLSSANINEIVKTLISEPSIFVDFEAKAEKMSHLLNIRNGVLDISKGEFYPRDTLSKDAVREYCFNYYLDFEYSNKSKIDDAPNFANFLKTSLDYPEDEEKTVLLLQIMGVCVSSVRGHRKAFFFTGMPRSGKSLIAKLISSVIVPQEAVTGFSLHKLGERFNGPHLVNARLNVDTENTISAIKDCDVFKKLVAEEPYFVEGKGQTGFVGCPHVKLLTCGNALPKFENVDASGNQALADRMVILNFSHSISDEDKDFNLFEKLCDEKDIVFSVAVDALVELVKRDLCFAEPEDSKTILKQWNSESRSVHAFVEDMCIFDGAIHKADLYSAYQKYCSDNCVPTQKSNVFFEALYANFPSLTNAKFVNNGRYRWGVKGISIKEII